MKGVVVREPGGPDCLEIADVPDVQPGPEDVVIRVAATAINRADVIQRQGNYTPPPGASPVLGLECSGWVSEVGEDVTRWRVDDPVCALLPGGGYADAVVVDQGQLMAIPDTVSMVEAACLPEAACTVWSSLFMDGGLVSGETCLIHGGTGGIGTLAIQVAHERGCWVGTTGSGGKLPRCRELGADLTIDYRGEDFVERFAAAGRQADVILDAVGGPYLARNVEALAPDGRLVIIGVQGGANAQVNLRALIRRRVSLHLTSLRGRPRDQKRAIVDGVVQEILPAVAQRRIVPVIDRSFALEDVVAAHRYFDSGEHVGKVVIRTGAVKGG